MRTTFAAIFGLIVGVGLGFFIPRVGYTKDGLKSVPYFDVRPTATGFHGPDVRTDGPIRGWGSQEIAFLRGDSTVRVYLVSMGKKELLHDLDVKPDWFRSIWFTPFQRQSGSVGLELNAQSLLQSANQEAIPDGYGDDKHPSIFNRHWQYDLGKIESITPSCNLRVTTSPLWKPGIEVPALCYQFSRERVDSRILHMEGNILWGTMSERAMIAASSAEQNVGFILVTVEVRPE